MISANTPAATVDNPTGPKQTSGKPNMPVSEKQPEETVDDEPVIAGCGPTEFPISGEPEAAPGPDGDPELGAADTVKLSAGADTPPTDQVSDQVPTVEAVAVPFRLKTPLPFVEP